METWLESSGKWEVDFSDERLTNFRKDFHGISMDFRMLRFLNFTVLQYLFFRMVSERFPAIFARALSRT